jgi:interferon-induced GTP-binding protein Mx1
MGKGSRVPPFPSTHVERDSNISEPLSIALVSVAELGQESTMLTNVVDASVELGKESAMLTDVVDASVGPIINLIDQLRAVGIEKDIQIPQIAVMGDQSSGKSSVLESVSGIPFPRGSGLVTKCATELRMKKAPPGTAWSATIKLSWLLPQPSSAGKVDSYEEIGERISKLTEALLLARGTHATFEAEHSIVIDLIAPNVPDLTVIDLPGIVRTQVTGQTGDVIKDVDHLLGRYLKQERTIILCVIPSNVDIATVDILERAHKVDPDGVRTIGVLTKPDTIGEGNEEEVLQVVQGLRKPLNLGYLMVKNRSQKQIDDGITLMDARDLEMSFFNQHSHFSTVNASFFGVENLMSRLTSVLVTRIQEGLPSMRKEISTLKEKTVGDLNEMGQAPPIDEAEVRAMMIKLSQQVSGIMGEAVKGEYSNGIFGSSDMRMMAQIRADDGPHEVFRKAVLACKPIAEWEVECLRKQIASMRGRELPGFLNWKVFDLLLKQAVRLWKEPALKLLQSIKVIVENVCDAVIETAVPQYPSLAAGMKQIVQNEVEKRSTFVRKTILEQWLSVESDAFTLQVEFFELYNQKKVERFQQAFDQMSPDLMQMFYQGNDEATDQARQKMTEWYKQTHSVGDRTNEHHEAEDMKMLLESYWKTAVDRAIDSMCMKVDQHVIRGLDEEILSSLINLSFDNDRCTSFFAQDPRIREKRVQLEARFERLEKAQALISSSV